MSPRAHSFAALTAALLFVPAVIGLALRRSWRDGFWERLSVRIPSATAQENLRATNESSARTQTGDATHASRAQTKAKPVWLHAASVGEASAALRLVDLLAARPGGVVVTTTTVAGRALLRARRPGLACTLAPLDHPWTAARALAVRDPAALVLVETELWPCLLHAAAARDVPVVVVSGRLGARSLRRVTRVLRRFAFVRRAVQRGLAHIQLLGARSERDAESFAALGVARERIVVSGDLKLETAPARETIAPELARALPSDAPLWIAGSTHESEESAALDALEAAEAAGHALALLLAPRRPERFEQVAEIVRARGRTLLRRSELQARAPQVVAKQGGGNETDASQVGGAQVDASQSETPQAGAQVDAPQFEAPQAGAQVDAPQSEASESRAQEVDASQSEAPQADAESFDAHARALKAGEVLLLDSLGELAPLWGRARLAFVGGTLAPVGGHNLLEPVARGVPVMFGPHTENVREAAALLVQNGAGVEVANAQALTRAVLRALAASEEFRARGERGRAALATHAGASARSLALIERALSTRSARTAIRSATTRRFDARAATLETSAARATTKLGAARARSASTALLTARNRIWYETKISTRRRIALLPLALLSQLWSFGARLHRAWYERGPGRAQKLQCAVISVGNIVQGGSGKTPTVALLANALRARGERVVIASRGYGGRSARAKNAVEVVSDGRRVRGRYETSGDEPMWLASRAPGVPVLVGRRRDAVGHFAVAAFDASVLLLDDGFQHHRLARDLNLLTFHGTGLGNARVFPRGPLRENLRALARADAVLVVDGPLPARDAARIRRAAPSAEWFEVQRTPSRVCALTGGASRAAHTLKGRAVGVLSGVARPQAVRASVEKLGARVVAERAFADHHAYTARDLQGLGALAPLWITTEKDAGKIPPSFVRGFTLEVLALETQITDAPRFLAWLEERLQTRRR